MDPIILSSRSFMVLSLFFMLFGVAAAFASGEWNCICEDMERKTRRWLYRPKVYTGAQQCKKIFLAVRCDFLPMLKFFQAFLYDCIFFLIFWCGATSTPVIGYSPCQGFLLHILQFHSFTQNGTTKTLDDLYIFLLL